MRAILLVVLLTTAAQAQQADCLPSPTSPDDRMSLDVAIPLAGRPGVPKSARGGYVGFGLQDVPANGTTCGATSPRLPKDVLHGDPSGDLLMGTPPRGQVFIDVK